MTSPSNAPPQDICANCGKIGGDNNDDDNIIMTVCYGCRLVKYCGRDCKKMHSPEHTALCNQQAARLYEEKLFAIPPEPGKCPVCLLRMPFEQGRISFRACCGQTICAGCMDATRSAYDLPFDPSAPHAGVYYGKMYDRPCPHCRRCGGDHLQELRRRVDIGDFKAMYHLGIKLLERTGSAKPAKSNAKKAKELLLKSAESGYPLANLSVGMFCCHGTYPGVFDKNLSRARKFFDSGAMGGDPIARTYLGDRELDRFQYRNASRHYMIAASCGYDLALECVHNAHKNGTVSKTEYDSTLRAYTFASNEMKSEHRSGGIGMYDVDPRNPYPFARGA